MGWRSLIWNGIQNLIRCNQMIIEVGAPYCPETPCLYLVDMPKICIHGTDAERSTNVLPFDEM